MPPFSKLRRAMHLLLQAQEYAEELNRDPWNFAVGLSCLREAGLSVNDVRWLLYQGFLTPGVEVEGDQRFALAEPLACPRRLSPESCFLLTTEGLQFAQGREIEMPARLEPGPENGHRREVEQLRAPEWVSCRRTLFFKEFVVKQFKVPAPNQEIVLATFEEEDWPVRIDDPLPPSADIVAKQRLHDTITSLNRNQKNPLLRFYGDGSGEAICWDVRQEC